MTKLDGIKPVVRLAITNDNSDSHSMYGLGVALLCKGVREEGSLNAAAKNMQMAYSKAWRIVKETEEALGFQLLDRDGAHGSTLTAEGDQLLDAYIKTNEMVGEYAKKAFTKQIGH